MNTVEQLNKYLAEGWKIFPLKPDSKEPFTNNGFYEAVRISEDKVALEYWNGKTNNWGVSLGDSDLAIIDVDIRNGGSLEIHDDCFLIYSEEGYSQRVPATRLVKTGGGGYHLYYKGAYKLPKKLSEGLDLKSIGGYVVIPPSIHPSGNSYEWLNDLPLADFPQNLVALGKRGDKPVFQLPANIKEGERNTDLFKFGCFLRAKGSTEEEILIALQTLNQTRGNPPLDKSEVETIAESVCRYEQGTIEKYNLTDLGNAKRLIEIHGDEILFCRSEKEWYIWNGKKWEKDTRGKIYLLAENVIRLLHKEASEAKDSEERKQLAQHAFRSESSYSIHQMVALAENHCSVTLDEFDTDKELLNVANGIVNLRTGELIPHDSKYLMRKIINIDYSPNSQCPKWLAFLDLVLNKDGETIHWIQKALGLSISGRADRVLPFLYGSGGNGKSVFSETLLKLFEDYAQKTNIDAFSVSDFREAGDKPNSYIARLKGARFVIANETREDGKLNVSLMKDLTGVDTITGRGLHANAQEFTPTHTIWVYGNHKPVINDTTDSIWDRLSEIKFSVKIPDNIKRPLDEVVNEFMAEGAGILSWIILGYQLWIKEGLKKTRAIETATNEYRDEEDIFRQFINEEMEFGNEFFITKDEFIQQYTNYCNRNGERKSTLTKAKITRRMKEMGIEDSGRGRKFFSGIRKDSFEAIENKANTPNETVEAIFSN